MVGMTEFGVSVGGPDDGAKPVGAVPVDVGDGFLRRDTIRAVTDRMVMTMARIINILILGFSGGAGKMFFSNGLFSTGIRGFKSSNSRFW